MKRNIVLRIGFYILATYLVTFSSWAETMKPFSLPSLSGEGTVSSESHKGKVILVDFWASWCEPCKASFPAYNELYEKYKDQGLEIIAINIDDNKENALEFLDKYPASFHVASDTGKNTAQAYNLSTMPSLFIIDRSGNIAHTHAGYHKGDMAEIEQEVKSML
ncbi:MAG: TlpA family protein disulfide reductase [Alphaproteobacteria bacterium]|nr:TlpA family protein disulfide reductase [Alphaproteobacteria bacterium]